MTEQAQKAEQPKEPAATNDIAPIVSRWQKAIEQQQQKWLALPPEERARIEGARQAEAAAALNRSVEAKLLSAGAPKRQLESTGLKEAGAWGETKRDLIGRSGTGFLIALIGPRGAGKTQLAVELMRSCARADRSTKFCSVMGFFMEVKAAYKHETKTEADVITEFERPALLVLDEIAVRADTDWETRLLYELLNRRYEQMKDTLLLSNQTLTDISQALGDSLMSRINETGGIVRCDWPSFRK